MIGDDSTPKKTATSKKPFMSDFSHLCTESAIEPSEAQQPKTSYVSMDNIFNISCRWGEERLSLNFIFEKLGFSSFQSYLLSPCVKEQRISQDKGSDVTEGRFKQM